MKPWHRLSASVVVAVCAAGLLAACTPKPDPNLALRRGTDGSVEALVFVCRTDAVSRLSVYDRDADETWTIDRPPGEPSRAEKDTVITFRLFDRPRDWIHIDGGLSALDPARRYGISASTVNSSDPRLWFSLRDLDLADGTVLAGQDADLRKVKQRAFERTAQDTCP